jgi:hypothetical protein
MVLLLSFFGCVVLAISVPTAVNWYVMGATQPNTAELEAISGTSLLQQVGDRAEVGIQATQRLQEGDAVRTPSDAQAIVWLPFDRNTNVRLWPNSRLTMQNMQVSHYTDALTNISLNLKEGHCRIEVAPPSTKSRRLEIVTPTARVMLRGEGSYSIEVSTIAGQTITQVVTHNGSASVSAANKTVEVLRAERTEVRAGQTPADPTPAARNLIVNGDFRNGLDSGWVADGRAEDGVMPSVNVDFDDGLTMAHFQRSGSSKHGEAFLVQQINRDVTDFESLELSFEAKLLNQSLSGGGWMGSEYPLMVRLRYRDVAGNENLWVKGFYYQNKDNLPVTNGTKLSQGSWQRQAAPFDLFDPAVAPNRPAYLMSIELVASGWDFNSGITDVRLIAE